MARYLTAALAVALILLPSCVRAQHAEDSVADHLLRTTDEPTIDVESIFDEAEALATHIPFTARTRYIIDPDAYDESGYLDHQFLGSPAATLAKVQTGYGPLAAGFAGQKDAWEQSLADDWSGFLELREPLSIGQVDVQKSVAGSYALTFGSGLIFGPSSSALYLRSSAARMPPPLSAIRHLLSPHSQTSLFGATTLATLGRFSLVPFYSRRHLDARLDSLGVASIYPYLHRTPSEVANRNALGVSVGGAHLEYADTSVRFGLTFSHTDYDQPLHTQSSRIITGSNLDNAGLNAMIDLSSAQLSLEAAGARADSTFGRAIYGSLAVNPSQRLRLLAIYHRQDTNYFAPFAATAVSSEGDITNSEGYWLGFDSRVAESVALSGAIAMEHKLQALSDPINAPAFDEFLDLRYTPSAQFSAALRYRDRSSSALVNNVQNGRTITASDDRSQSNVRLIARYVPLEWLVTNLRFEVTSVSHSAGDILEHGGFIQLNCRLARDANSVGFNVARFSTSSYDSRLYSYASEVSGYGSMLLFSGTGYFVALALHRELLPWLTLEAFAGGYFYDHGRTIGSGLTERSGSRDLSGALQLSFTQRP